MPPFRHASCRTVGRAGTLALLLLAGTAYGQESPIQVTVATLASLAYQPLYTAPATTLSLSDSRVTARIQGRVERIRVRVGDRVQLGATLVELECESYLSVQKQARAAKQRARSELQLARRQLERTKVLRRERSVAEEVLNQREANLSSAEADLLSADAALEIASNDVADCRILAPFDGVVSARLVSLGEWASPGTPLVRLLDTGQLEVTAQIPLAHTASLQAGDIELVSDEQHYPVRLRRLLPLIDSRGRHREARLEFVEKRALPGSSGRLQWRATRPHLPSHLLVRRQKVLGVMLEKDGLARFEPIPGALEGHPAAMELPAASRLIIEGRQGLNDGDKVEVRP